MKRTEPELPAAVLKCYDFTLWILPKVEKFNRAYRFTIGERLTNQTLDLLNTLVEAAYTRQKEDLLVRANRQVNAIRFLLRLAKDLKLLTIDSYVFASEQLNEVGRMAGGWLKSVASSSNSSQQSPA